jgi:beta-lactamase class D
MKPFFTCLTLFLLSVFSVRAQDDASRLREAFRAFGYDGAFILAPLEGEAMVRVSPERCGKAVIPASTFKIPNSCIALETGVIGGVHDTLRWDGKRKSFRSWEEDMDMSMAFQRSCVWFYQELARRVGSRVMGQWLDRLDYGNRSIGGGIDRFWLDGKMRISPDQQIAFLRKLFTDALPFNPEVMRQVRELMVLERGEHHTLYGKTGWGIIDGTHYGWLVGAIDVEGGIWVYATLLVRHNADASTFPQARHDVTRALLREARLLPRE